MNTARNLAISGLCILTTIVPGCSGLFGEGKIGIPVSHPTFVEPLSRVAEEYLEKAKNTADPSEASEYARIACNAYRAIGEWEKAGKCGDSIVGKDLRAATDIYMLVEGDMRDHGVLPELKDKK
jgi:hypothetical protein